MATNAATAHRGGWLARERTVADPGFNRWLVPPAALCVHLCIGEVYAFSVFNKPLSLLNGTVGPDGAGVDPPWVTWADGAGGGGARREILATLALDTHASLC